MNYICKWWTKFRCTITCLIIAGKGWKSHAWTEECASALLRCSPHSRPLWLWMLRSKPENVVLPPWWCHSACLGLTGPPHTCEYYRLRLSGSERWQLRYHCYRPNSCNCVQMLPKYKPCQESPSGSESFSCTQVKWQVALCPSINSETISSVGLCWWPLHIFWRTPAKNSDWSVDVIIYVLKAVCVCVCTCTERERYWWKPLCWNPQIVFML